MELGDVFERRNTCGERSHRPWPDGGPVSYGQRRARTCSGLQTNVRALFSQLHAIGQQFILQAGH